jgi:hypothetical protein
MAVKFEMRPIIRGALGLMMGAAMLSASTSSFAEGGPDGPGGPPPPYDGGEGGDRGAHGQGDGKGKHGDRMLEEMDADKDGSISKGEFLMGMEGKFNELDSDGDGVATPDELKAHHKAKRAEMKEKFSKMKEKRRMKQGSAQEDADK